MIESIEQGRKEDGNRSIADKIIKRLHDLDKTVENNQGRWAWELLQNAKDSIAEEEDRTVSVQIELNQESVEFRHNGTHFTERDIRGLINQISSKEIEEGQHTKKTGRFGTGFLTTHLLSKVIQIKGIVQTESKDFYSFAFPLDRKGKTTTELVPKIENAWSEFHKSAQKTENNYDRSDFNTAFCYRLETESQRLIAKIGIEEFSKLIPFVLAFIPKISRVEIIDNTAERKSIFERKNDSLFDGLIIPILRIENQKEYETLILFSSKNKVAIAAEIEKIENGYSVKNNINIPKIFCDFPLIGTENFHFPVIVNSFFFNPQTERDGVWLKGTDDLEVKENQEILECAVELYKDLVSRISEQNFFDLYNLAETKKPDTNEKYFDENWYKYFIQTPLKEFIFNANIVELENEENRKSISSLWFPLKSYPDKVQLKLWEFIHDLSPQSVCRRNQLHEWCKLSWDSWQFINYQVLSNTIAGKENINKLSQVLGKDENITFDWLNSICNFILEDDTNLNLFEKYTIIPNQNGDFQKKSNLYIDEIESEDLINILKLLGDNWRDILLNKKIKFGEYYPKNKKDIADKITEKVNKIQSYDSFKEAISRLLEWFDNYPKLGEEFFSELYRQRAELFVNIIEDKDSFYDVIRSNSDFKQLSSVAQTLADNPQLIQKIADMDNLLKEFGVTEIADLKEMMLNTAKNLSVDSPRIVITQDVLLSLGITSIDEFNEALKDKHLSNQFIHTSTPSKDMFDYVQALISRIKTNIIEHLKSLDEYNCDDLEELATTVIGGIKKDGRDIYIVIRPSDNRQVIIYYGSEKDILDNADAELWIDNGVDKPRHLTLGKILKKTGINKIPV